MLVVWEYGYLVSVAHFNSCVVAAYSPSAAPYQLPVIFIADYFGLLLGHIYKLVTDNGNKFSLLPGWKKYFLYKFLKLFFTRLVEFLPNSGRQTYFSNTAVDRQGSLRHHQSCLSIYPSHFYSLSQLLRCPVSTNQQMVSLKHLLKKWRTFLSGKMFKSFFFRQISISLPTTTSRENLFGYTILYDFKTIV